jgi:hypothetical protein
MSPRREGFVRAMRVALATSVAVATFGIGGCRPDHSGAENITGSVLTGDKGEIKGVLTEVGGPAGASPQPVQGTVDVFTLGGNDLASISPVSAWDFELEPGTYTVQATANGLVCGPIKAKVIKATVPLACSIK